MLVFVISFLFSKRCRFALRSSNAVAFDVKDEHIKLVNVVFWYLLDQLPHSEFIIYPASVCSWSQAAAPTADLRLGHLLVSKTYRRLFAYIRPYELKLNVRILYEAISVDVSGQKGQEDLIWWPEGQAPIAHILNRLWSSRGVSNYWFFEDWL